MRTIRPESTHDKIIKEVRKALKSLASAKQLRLKTRNDIVQLFSESGAPQDLLAVINSWGDTLSDEEVLGLLREFNRSGTIWDEVFATAH